MYRIKFNPKTAVWQIALQKFGFFWVCIEGKEFANYDDAQAYVVGVGLNKVYRSYSDSYTAQVMNGQPNMQGYMR